MFNDRMNKLKDYLSRLGEGEDLEKVRADFVENFRDVEASDIMKAEQELIKEGTPITKVQKLCDVHSALFHGATRQEQIANAEKAVEESLKKEKVANVTIQNSKKAESSNVTIQDSKKQEGSNVTIQDSKKEERSNVTLQSNKKVGTLAAIYEDKHAIAKEISGIKGHPLYTFTKENSALQMLLVVIKGAFNDGMITPKLVAQIREIAIHYAKKGDLLYPHLKTKYDISGPSDVMWTVDDEIRDELNRLGKFIDYGPSWYEKFEVVLKRIEEMIYKENNILFPICAVNFSKEEWYRVYQDSKDYAECFNVKHEVWEEAEEALKNASSESYLSQSTANDTDLKDGISEKKFPDGEIVMPGGHMSVRQLTAILNTIPLEISFVDDKDINRFFNEGPKVFKRPGMAIDRDVFSCHPPKIEPMVRNILNSFREGTKDSVPVWMNKNGRTMLVTYMAVRDKEQKYLGTLEIVQDMEFAKEHFENAGQGMSMPDPSSLY